MPINVSGPWSDTTSTFQSMSLDDDDDFDEVCEHTAYRHRSGDSDSVSIAHPTTA